MEGAQKMEEINIEIHATANHATQSVQVHILSWPRRLPMDAMSLKQSLLRALAQLPDARTFHLYTLVSEPVRDQDVFLYSSQRPKAHIRQLLVLLAQHPPTRPEERVFVCAVEAFIYTIPSTSSSIVYISKVDSTGQGTGIRPNPTRALVVSLLQYYTAPATRPASHVWVHVFARAQNQYLFPNSIDYPGKRVLRDINLCKWWKESLEQVARQTDPGGVRLYYLLPGYSSLEARAMLRQYATNTATAYPWTYSHPYNQTYAPFPCGGAPGEDGSPSIAQLIPSLPDDPKARFLDEIASTPSESPDSRPALPTNPRPAKRIRTNAPAPTKASEGSGSSSTPLKTTERASPGAQESGSDATRKGKIGSVTPGAQRALATVSADEFFERMAFRQECSQGAVTGFFTAIFPSPLPTSTVALAPSTLAPSSASPLPNDAHTTPASNRKGAAEEIPGQQPPFVLERVISTLLNVDFGSTEHARRSTRLIEDSIRAMCGGSSSVKEYIPPAGASDTRLPSGRSGQTALDIGKEHGHIEEGGVGPEAEIGVTSARSGPASPDLSQRSHQHNSPDSADNRPGGSLSQIDEAQIPAVAAAIPSLKRGAVADVAITQARDEGGIDLGQNEILPSGPFALVYGTVTVTNAPLPLPLPASAVSGAEGLAGSSTIAGGGGAASGPNVTVLQVRKKKRPAAVAS